MKRVAFRMHLHKGNEDEYIKRHHEIPRELTELLKTAGISDYSIFLDDDTGNLFAIMTIESEEKLKQLAVHPVMKKWWTFMKDIMETNPDHSPVSVHLKEVFNFK